MQNIYMEFETLLSYKVVEKFTHRRGIMSKFDCEQSGQCRSNNFVSDSIFISPFPAIHKNSVCFLNSWGMLVVYIPNNTNPDQTVPIWVSDCLLPWWKKSGRHRNICSRHKKQTTFSGQKYWQDKGENLFMLLRTTKAQISLHQSDQCHCYSLIQQYNDNNATFKFVYC